MQEDDPRKGARLVLGSSGGIDSAPKQSAKNRWKQSISVVQAVNRNEDAGKRKASNFWGDVLATAKSVDAGDHARPETDEDEKRAMYMRNLKQRMSHSRIELDDKKVVEIHFERCSMLSSMKIAGSMLNSPILPVCYYTTHAHRKS
jgi:hypothetical protein